jgi:hypothetical protein
MMEDIQRRTAINLLIFFGLFGIYPSLGPPHAGMDRTVKRDMLHYSFQLHSVLKSMLFSKEYVGYLARQVSQKLIAGEFIEAKTASEVSAALNNALLEELQLEDRINDEVRLILDQIQDEMQRAGASYQEMFKKVKGELVRKYKAVL